MLCRNREEQKEELTKEISSPFLVSSCMHTLSLLLDEHYSPLHNDIEFLRSRGDAKKGHRESLFFFLSNMSRRDPKKGEESSKEEKVYSFVLLARLRLSGRCDDDDDDGSGTWN